MCHRYSCMCHPAAGTLDPKQQPEDAGYAQSCKITPYSIKPTGQKQYPKLFQFSAHALLNIFTHFTDQRS